MPNWITDGEAKAAAPSQATCANFDYADAEGNVLSLRQSLSAGTIAKIGEAPAGMASSLDDAWRRRAEMLFERLASAGR